VTTTLPDMELQPEQEQHRGQLRLAERLTHRHHNRLRHAHGLGWYQWDNTRWAPDTDGAAMRAAVDTIKAALNQLPYLAKDDRDHLYADIRKSETAGGLEGILRIATNLRPIAVAATTLDADPYLFNTPDGTLDLRTGQLRPPDPADLITKISGCGLDPDVDTTAFDTFMTQILPDPDVRGFIQRLVGSSMLGKVHEHILPIFTGVGRNGKSTLLNLLKKAFGEYAINCDPELLVDKGHAHPTGQADLLGVRLAVLAETEEGRPLAAATAKRLTGGDPIRARKMRKDFIEFDPSHTVIMVTNFKPKVAGDDPAMWRRIRVVPFDVVVEHPDPHLPTRLELALPAALRWAVDGYRMYAEQGLDAPEAVLLRTKQYQVSSDALGRFLDEQVVASGSSMVKTKARDLFSAWSRWCHTNGENAGSEIDFATAMSRRGFDKRKSHGTMMYAGLSLLAGDDEEDQRWSG
jgi:putative DNA primase/helicase